MESKLKPLVWVATSGEDLKEFPDEVQRSMGYALYLAQAGKKHLEPYSFTYPKLDCDAIGHFMHCSVAEKDGKVVAVWNYDHRD